MEKNNDKSNKHQQKPSKRTQPTRKKINLVRFEDIFIFDREEEDKIYTTRSQSS
tara:strand:- start:841 stop:1002 length:162 start_codon:yes stop_codon:yes gene_type:complete